MTLLTLLGFVLEKVYMLSAGRGEDFIGVEGGSSFGRFCFSLASFGLDLLFPGLGREAFC
jgi:hypothetical protein